jgi:hypothetical protein
MRRAIKRGWLWTGLALVGVMFIGGREAQAKGIIITSGGTQKTGDPTYEYVFTVDLLAGSTLDNGGFFTVYDLPALTAGALTSQPSISWGASVQLLGNTPIGTVVNDDPNIYNVTWQWNGKNSVTAPATSNLDLGTFIVGSTTELASPPSKTVVYVGSLDGVNASNQGTVGINVVPEPSSVILLLVGAAALPLYAVRNRRGRSV